MEPKGEVFTTREAMTFLKITRPTLMKLIREKKIKVNRAGRNYRYLKSEIEIFLRGEGSQS